MIGSLFTLAGETLSAIGRMIERPAFNDEAAEQFLGGRWESDGPDAADVLADFEERVEVFEPPLIPRSSTAATPPRLVDRREPPATPSVVEAPGTQSSECPGCSDFACPGPHPTPPGAYVCFAASRRRSAGGSGRRRRIIIFGRRRRLATGRPAQRIRPAAVGLRDRRGVRVRHAPGHAVAHRSTAHQRHRMKNAPPGRTRTRPTPRNEEPDAPPR